MSAPGSLSMDKDFDDDLNDRLHKQHPFHNLRINKPLFIHNCVSGIGLPYFDVSILPEKS